MFVVDWSSTLELYPFIGSYDSEWFKVFLAIFYVTIFSDFDLINYNRFHQPKPVSHLTSVILEIDL